MSFKKIFRLAIGGVLAGIFVWLISRQINLEELRNAFVGTDPFWIGAALLAFCSGYASRIERWRLMLIGENPALRWHHCAGPLLSSFAANNVLPFRAGDVLRAFAFNGRLGTSAGTVLATLFVERLLDLLMVVLMLLAALVVFQLDANRFAGLGSSALAIIALGIWAIIVFPQVFFPLARAVGKLAVKISPRIGQKLAQAIDKILFAMRGLAQAKHVSRLLIWSFAAWLSEGCVFWFAALALPALEFPEAGWLALPVGTLSTLIPSTPGYIGTFDYFTGYAMTALGNPQALAVAFAIMVHALLWFPPTIIGGLYMFIHRSKKPELVQELD